jgi:hypothetical protein
MRIHIHFIAFALRAMWVIVYMRSHLVAGPHATNSTAKMKGLIIEVSDAYYLLVPCFVCVIASNEAVCLEATLSMDSVQVSSVRYL